MGPYLNLIVGFLIIIVPATLLCFWGKKTGMWLIVVAGFVVLAFANIDKIQRFKIAGIEAEMRKAVQKRMLRLNS
jgi:small basic protein